MMISAWETPKYKYNALFILTPACSCFLFQTMLFGNPQSLSTHMRATSKTTLAYVKMAPWPISSQFSPRPPKMREATPPPLRPWGQLFKNRSSRKSDSQWEKRSSMSKILLKIVSENRFSGKTYFYTIHPRMAMMMQPFSRLVRPKKEDIFGIIPSMVTWLEGSVLKRDDLYPGACCIK